MGPGFFIIAIMGCADGSANCTPVATVPTHFASEAAWSAATGDALAGKVVGKDGLLLVDWHLGDRLLTSGFRADDHSEHERLVGAISEHVKTEAA